MSQNAFEEIKISPACNIVTRILMLWLYLKMSLKKKKSNTLKPRDKTHAEEESSTSHCQILNLLLVIKLLFVSRYINFANRYRALFQI